VGEVVGVSGRLVTVKTVNGTMVHDWSGLVKIEKPSPLAASVPQLREEDIEEDVEPETKPHEREWSEGISIGGNNLDASDKVDSVASIPQLIIQPNTFNFNFLLKLMAVAQLLNDGQTTMLINDLMKMTDQDASQMAASGQLKGRLDTIYGQMGNAMESWMTGQFADVLNQIETAVN
jgi:hypothetical protein